MNHNDAIRLFAKTLQNLEQWMDKAAAYAKAKSFEVDVLAQARLAPDQYAFVRQVQSACDQAKYAAAYLGGKPAPSHPVGQLPGRDRNECVDQVEGDQHGQDSDDAEAAVLRAQDQEGIRRVAKREQDDDQHPQEVHALQEAEVKDDDRADKARGDTP